MESSPGLLMADSSAVTRSMQDPDDAERALVRHQKTWASAFPANFFTSDPQFPSLKKWGNITHPIFLGRLLPGSRESTRQTPPARAKFPKLRSGKSSFREGTQDQERSGGSGIVIIFRGGLQVSLQDSKQSGAA